MTRVFIGIGSNLGNKEKNIVNAIKSLREKCQILKISSLYKTAPLGYKDQGWFLNCVIEIDTALKPKELLYFLQIIEKKLKKIITMKNGPRTIDLDILLYGDTIVNYKDLIIPHPRLHERLFVLVPLNEISPHSIHPILKKSISELLQSFDKQQGIELFRKDFSA